MENPDYDDSYMQLMGTMDTTMLALKHVPRIPITRQEAINQGLRFYYTGKPCSKGHYAPRYIDGRTCTMCDAYYPPDYNYIYFNK